MVSIIPFLLGICFAAASLTLLALVARNKPPLWLLPWWWPGRQATGEGEPPPLAAARVYSVISAVAMAVFAWSLLQIAFGQGPQARQADGLRNPGMRATKTGR